LSSRPLRSTPRPLGVTDAPIPAVPERIGAPSGSTPPERGPGRDSCRQARSPTRTR